MDNQEHFYYYITVMIQMWCGNINTAVENCNSLLVKEYGGRNLIILGECSDPLLATGKNCLLEAETLE